MNAVAVAAVVGKPLDEVWATLRDLRAARHYVPGVMAIEFNPGPREGIGASRKVFMNGRSPVDETVVAWVDGCGYTLKIHNGDKAPSPFKWACFRYQLEALDARQTRVRGELAYEMAWGALGKLLDVVIIRPSLRRTNLALEQNMRRFYETGESANLAAG